MLGAGSTAVENPPRLPNAVDDYSRGDGGWDGAERAGFFKRGKRPEERAVKAMKFRMHALAKGAPR